MKGKKVQSEKHYCYSHNLRAKRVGLKNDYIVDDHYAMLEHFGDACVYCGKEYPSGTDHIIPISKGGGSTRQNIAPCCHSCNSRKHISDWKEWYRNQDYFNEERYSLIEKWLGEYKGKPIGEIESREITCYTPVEVAEMLQINKETVLRKIRSGKLKAFKVGILWRITKEEYENYKNGKERAL